ncbi:hypothetical protein SARC_00585 [Sphaeroforma arctica JP610]|uniref:Uncharacterized protein n=1 Tax=Sphaeroforma arctica JP610 TaxID=667725 RepID=A0A0L0GEI3_9EUKA|nr:hypothetical protein SARC_00585 [Sphaeroforma arctica JP610]KNC87304.1 hypothetical protein SARC_00585 [Sphaeroforma arctica JP610]|eukprot:XP_014161206.1 hypothetical protein SARC_00585 [Sphaeroforma arctica JP610]
MNNFDDEQQQILKVGIQWLFALTVVAGLAWCHFQKDISQETAYAMSQLGSEKED